MRLVEISDLPMDKASRMARAKALGFTIPAYHGTGSKFTAFDLEKGKPHVTGGYAPMFSDKRNEAAGYANGHLLPVLLRLKKPFVVSYDEPISPDLYQQITGEQAGTHPTSYRALAAINDKQGWHDHRRTWTNTYAHLMTLGYDALVYPNTPADHIDGHHTKYVVFEPKNIRLTSAQFDPAKSDSANLKA